MVIKVFLGLGATNHHESNRILVISHWSSPDVSISVPIPRRFWRLRGCFALLTSCLTQQVVMSAGIEHFGIANVGAIQVAKEVDAGRQGDDPHVLLPSERLLGGRVNLRAGRQCTDVLLHARQPLDRYRHHPEWKGTYLDGTFISDVVAKFLFSRHIVEILLWQQGT